MLTEDVLYIDGIYDLEGIPWDPGTLTLESYTENIPAVTDQLICAGIPPVNAEKMAKKFGCRVFEILRKNPEELCHITGIKSVRAKDYATRYKKYCGSNTDRELQYLCRRYHLTDSQKKNAGQKYVGNPGLLKNNPYLLAEDGICPFEMIDTVEQAAGMVPDNAGRIKAAIKLSIKKKCRETGSTSVSPNDLVAQARSFLGSNVPAQTLKAHLNYYSKNGTLIYQYQRIYDGFHYHVECELASMVVDMLHDTLCMPVPVTDDQIEAAEEKRGIHLEDLQKEAIKMVFSNKFSVLTGGPGTGKSTTIAVLTDLYQELRPHSPISLMAPTARAAQRMSEVCGFPARTLHSELALSIEEDDLERFSPINSGLVIVDETSMLDNTLLYRLFKAVQPGVRLLLIGDYNQLPSIREGAALRDLVALGKMGVIPCVCLKILFRQESKSKIPVLGAMLNNGTFYGYNQVIGQDIQYIPLKKPQEILDMLVMQFGTAMQYGWDIKNIIILSPLRKKGPLCTDVINEAIQDHINPKSNGIHEIVYKGTAFREGSRVIHMRNSKLALNGEMGTVISVSEENMEVVVRFDQKKEPVIYKRKDLPDLDLAYAVTVHKAIGSEFPVVIMPLHMSFGGMVTRKMFYTSVTRASKRLLLIGDLNVLPKAAVTTDNERVSYFGYRVLQISTAQSQNHKIAKEERRCYNGGERHKRKSAGGV